MKLNFYQLCQCTNCSEILFDANPSTDNYSVHMTDELIEEIEDMHEIHEHSRSVLDEDICPSCGSIDFIDVTYDNFHRILGFHMSKEDIVNSMLHDEDYEIIESTLKTFLKHVYQAKNDNVSSVVTVTKDLSFRMLEYNMIEIYYQDDIMAKGYCDDEL